MVPTARIAVDADHRSFNHIRQVAPITDGMSIGSSVFAQLTRVTNTDRHTDRRHVAR